jgi:hypothetical protein
VSKNREVSVSVKKKPFIFRHQLSLYINILFEFFYLKKSHKSISLIWGDEENLKNLN